MDEAAGCENIEEFRLVSAHDLGLFRRAGGVTGPGRDSNEVRMTMLSAIGLMSGTSYDGVDVALINTDGESIGRLGPTGYRAYSDRERTILRRAMAAAANLLDRGQRLDALVEAEAVLTAAHAEAVESFLAAHGMPASDIAVVGLHGQTVVHQPERRVSVQLGDGRAVS